jgi:hypothetical protein
VPLATLGASVGKSFVLALLSARLTAESRLGSFGAPLATGTTLKELRQALAAVGRYLATHQLQQERSLIRLDGQYGTGAVLTDLAGFAFVTRGKDYTVLDHPLVQARLHLPPDQLQQRPESLMVRSLYDCPEIPVGPEGVLCRVIVATHQASKKKSPVGVTRAGIVYELFFTNLPQRAFTAVDVVELYLHRGAIEPTLSDEDQEIDPDRWCSHSAWGRNAGRSFHNGYGTRRLELGHQLKPTPTRITEFAPAITPVKELATNSPAHTSGYSPPAPATRLGKLAASRERTLLSSPTEH